jgi:GTPase SAR1 family protein
VHAYYQGAYGVIVVYDVSSRHSFERAKIVYKEAREKVNFDGTVIVLLGNKSDVSDEARHVSLLEGEALAQELGGLIFMECSGVSGRNVEQALHSMVNEIQRRIHIESLPPYQEVISVLTPRMDDRSDDGDEGNVCSCTCTVM